MTRKSKRNFVQSKEVFEKNISKISKTSKSFTRKHVTCNCKSCKGRKVNLQNTSQSCIPIEDFIEDFIKVNEIELDNNSNSNEADNIQEFNFLVKLKSKEKQSEEESDKFDIDEDIYFSEDEVEEEGRTINFDTSESIYSDEYPDISTANIN
ncbi:5318_t:CDS:2 [Funneliformis caledonium]|uniref:5318_t:CDS:1 n=1 Tax=Funneliformis caledonium TaxID=1117310 RepID=A0A9N8WFI8_9GLOM|nr:5318_t:CDS:2 [Funneliformis caledonium]